MKRVIILGLFLLFCISVNAQQDEFRVTLFHDYSNLIGKTGVYNIHKSKKNKKIKLKLDSVKYITIKNGVSYHLINIDNNTSKIDGMIIDVYFNDERGKTYTFNVLYHINILKLIYKKHTDYTYVVDRKKKKILLIPMKVAHIKYEN